MIRNDNDVSNHYVGPISGLKRELEVDRKQLHQQQKTEDKGGERRRGEGGVATKQAEVINDAVNSPACYNGRKLRIHKKHLVFSRLLERFFNKIVNADDHHQPL